VCHFYNYTTTHQFYNYTTTYQFYNYTTAYQFYNYTTAYHHNNQSSQNLSRSPEEVSAGSNLEIFSV
jgi:hypothetical protein